jgi:hypothetical protein
MRYRVRVRLHEDFVEVRGDEIVVGIKSKPVHGEANAELVKKLAKHFKVPSVNIRIVSGLKSKNKIVEIGSFG